MAQATEQGGAGTGSTQRRVAGSVGSMQAEQGLLGPEEKGAPDMGML